MRFDKWFIVIGLVYLIAGMAIGEWVGASQNLQFAPVHSHLNLAGGVLLSLYGVLYRLYPGLGASILAWPQFLLSVLSVPVFAYGVYVVLLDPQNPGLVMAGSMAFLLGTVLFLGMFLTKAGAAKDQA